jgi:hypothetical protein
MKKRFAVGENLEGSGRETDIGDDIVRRQGIQFRSGFYVEARSFRVRRRIVLSIHTSVAMLGTFNLRTKSREDCGGRPLQNSLNYKHRYSATFCSPHFTTVYQRRWGALGGAVGWDTGLQAGRSRVRFPMGSLEFLTQEVEAPSF